MRLRLPRDNCLTSVLQLYYNLDITIVTLSIMRQVVSISLTKEEVRDLKRLAKKRGLLSISSYVKNLIMTDKENIISEAELLEDIKIARSEYKNGTLLKAKSMVELL